MGIRRVAEFPISRNFNRLGNFLILTAEIQSQSTANICHVRYEKKKKGILTVPPLPIRGYQTTPHGEVLLAKIKDNTKPYFLSGLTKLTPVMKWQLWATASNGPT